MESSGSPDETLDAMRQSSRGATTKKASRSLIRRKFRLASEVRNHSQMALGSWVARCVAELPRYTRKTQEQEADMIIVRATQAMADGLLKEALSMTPTNELMARMRQDDMDISAFARQHIGKLITMEFNDPWPVKLGLANESQTKAVHADEVRREIKGR